MTEHQFRRCSRCVLDTTVPEIRFDERGACQYCTIHDALDRRHPLGPEGARRLRHMVARIKREGRGSQYDCVVGVSGGRDSTYALYLTRQLGLRPLAVHFDNGWNSAIAVRNIKNACDALDVDLHTVVANWEEFKDLQRAFLFASVPDADVPTDFGMISTLYQVTAREGLRYVIEGHSFRTEGTSPVGWTYMDGLYVRSVHRRFGTGRITSFPILTLQQMLRHMVIDGVRNVRILEMIDYRQKEIMPVLEREVGWKYYGGHHHESEYTRFFQAYLKPKKFSIDERKTEFSALIRSGHMTREAALRVLESEPYETDSEIVDYCIRKLGITREQFERILADPRRSFRDFPTYFPLLRALGGPIRIATRLGALPEIVVLKYLQ